MAGPALVVGSHRQTTGAFGFVTLAALWPSVDLYRERGEMTLVIGLLLALASVVGGGRSSPTARRERRVDRTLTRRSRGWPSETEPGRRDDLRPGIRAAGVK